MANIISITNQKGGVGKTTTCVNIAASLSATKRKVLLIDIDPQGNATTGSGIEKEEVTLSACDLLLAKDTNIANKAIIENTEGGYDLIPSNSDLTAAEVELISIRKREFRLKNRLEKIKKSYDFIFIDCPPSLNMLTLNALVASDEVIIPVQCEYYALEGLTALLHTITGISETLNTGLCIRGILRTMYDPRIGLTHEVSNQLIEHFGDKVYRTVIPRNVRIAEAPSFGLPVLFYDKKSKGAIAYLALAGEMIRRQEKQKRSAVKKINSNSTKRKSRQKKSTVALEG